MRTMTARVHSRKKQEGAGGRRKTPLVVILKGLGPKTN
jgi:hypothetical protein